jgi:hypothetical protein
MTDAALAVTQSAVEQFTERYLSALGCPIEKRGHRWEVTVPEGTATELPNGSSVLVCGADASDPGEDEIPLHPESSFFRALLTDASERCRVGRLRLESGGDRVALPPWLRESAIESADTTFKPYYDRTAVAFLFRVSVETVSEYQTELLRAIALDTRSQEVVPGITDSVLQSTSEREEEPTTEATQLDEERAERLVDRVRPEVVEQVQPEVDEIHREASRAADAELEDYRQLQQQRIEEFEERVSKLTSRIGDLNEEIQHETDEEDRVESLKKRKDLQAELEEAEADLDDLRRRREQGFPEKQREIRERHELEVVVRPLSITQVEYESGEVELELVEGTATRTVTLGYGVGVGVTEEVACEFCDRPLSEQRPLSSIAEGLRCADCTPATR